MLCVVPNATYTAGTPYEGDTRFNCVQASAARAGLGPTVVWPDPVPGDYDLLAFTLADQDTIVAGDDLAAARGLLVYPLLPASRAPWLGAAVFLALACTLLRRQNRPSRRPS